jgi:hypothetical protein
VLLTRARRPRLARDVLHDGHGACGDELDRFRVGTDTVAGGTAGGGGSIEAFITQSRCPLVDNAAADEVIIAM